MLLELEQAERKTEMVMNTSQEGSHNPRLAFPLAPDSHLNQENKFERAYNKERFDALNLVDSQFVADSPMVYLDRRLVTLLLTRVKMFEKIIDIQGSIVECGVHRGNSLMTYYHLSSIFEPAAYNRKIIGFDTFEGFPSTSENDPAGILTGGMKDTNFEHLSEWIELQDKNRSIGHIPKVELVRGDACQTIPDYVSRNPHLIISLLYLDFDLYDPTLAALEHLLPLVPKGGLVGFDEVNTKKCFGETLALKKAIGVNNINLKRFYFDSHVSYFIVS